MLVEDLLSSIAPPDSDYVQKLIDNAPALRENIDDLNKLSETYEDRLKTFKAVWSNHRHEGIELAKVALIDVASPMITNFTYIEMRFAKQLDEIQALIRQHTRWMPSILRPLRRWEDFLIDAATFIRDVRWELMAIRAEAPREQHSVPFSSVGDLQRLVSRRR